MPSTAIEWTHWKEGVLSIKYRGGDAYDYFDVPEYERLLRGEAEKQLAELAKTVTTVKVHPILSQGDAADGILRAVDENQIDLIVIATAGHTGWDRVVFGSVAEKVVRRAKCPVLTVRRP